MPAPVAQGAGGRVWLQVEGFNPGGQTHRLLPELPQSQRGLGSPGREHGQRGSYLEIVTM